MRLSSSDLTLLRDSENHYTDLYLSIFQPNTIFTARVNDASIANGERSITYDGASGNWQDVKVGSTLLVGSTAGARDKGKIRIKSITSSVITVAENNYIQWSNNDYLTVLDYFDVWPIFPRIIQDPSDAEQVIFYKDYNIAYTNQNTKLGAFMNVGPHRAGFLENGSLPLYFSASGTYPLSGSISQVYWSFQSGTPSTYTGMVPGYVDWGTPGHYLVECHVSGTTGWGESAYRYVSVYDSPSDGVNVPPLKWKFANSPQASRAEGGYTMSIEVFEDVMVNEGSVVVIFTDEWYDGTHKSLGGNAPNSSKIKFVGYVLDNSIQYNYETSSVTFDVGSITEVMKKMEGFAIELQSKASPSKWFEMANVNAKKAIYHYLKWHTNIISLADIEYIGDDYLVQYFDSDRESIFDAIDNFMRSAYHGSVVADRQDKMYLEIDAWDTSNATGTFNPLFNMTKFDWIGRPSIKERRYPELSYLEYGGIAYSGVSTGTFAPLLANAPGDAPGYRGNSQKQQGYALGGQSHLNELVGNEFYNKNYQFPQIDFQMRGNWSNLDIAPQEVVQENIAASDTVRGVGISGLYMPDSMTWDFSPENKSFVPRITFKAVTTGPAGQTIPIPATPADGGYGSPGGGVSIPNIVPPTLPVSSSLYQVLKLETKGGVNKALPQNTYVEIPLTYIEFSSQGLPVGTASGTWGGLANIIPTVGASGTYGINYGFVTSYPGVYKASINVTVIDLIPSAPASIPVWCFLYSNSPYLGLLSEYDLIHYPLSDGTGEGMTLQFSTPVYLNAGGAVSFQVIQTSTYNGLVIDRATASLEFMGYG